MLNFNRDFTCRNAQQQPNNWSQLISKLFLPHANKKLTDLLKRSDLLKDLSHYLCYFCGMLYNPIQSNPINFESKMFVGLVVFLPLSQSCLDNGLKGFQVLWERGRERELGGFFFYWAFFSHCLCRQAVFILEKQLSCQEPNKYSSKKILTICFKKVG